MANYRVSTNTNNRTKATQDKTNKKQKTKKYESAKASKTQIIIIIY
jgi:hypothetical protein